MTDGPVFDMRLMQSLQISKSYCKTAGTRSQGLHSQACKHSQAAAPARPVVGVTSRRSAR